MTSPPPENEPSGESRKPEPGETPTVPSPLAPPPPPPIILAEVSMPESPDEPPPDRPLTAEDLESPRRRRVRLPLMLFLATCASCFLVGVTDWDPGLLELRRAVIRNWDQGLIYTGCVLAILLAHEMGHFLMTLRYRVPASFPYFIPMPITPIGTMGAVIGMDGMRADRRKMFDIGLAGPLAGLAVAVPVLWIGVMQLDLNPQSADGRWAFDLPWGIRLLMQHLHTPGYHETVMVTSGQCNPYFMAGWVGLLVTGLNMLPISQLDGGHVSYALFGRRAHWIARGFIFLAIGFVVFGGGAIWWPMLLLVSFIGTDHPPTADDTAELGPVRIVLGYVSLLIRLFCFPPIGLIQRGM